jgi:hypothetical protein
MSKLLSKPIKTAGAAAVLAASVALSSCAVFDGEERDKDTGLPTGERYYLTDNASINCTKKMTSDYPSLSYPMERLSIERDLNHVYGTLSNGEKFKAISSIKRCETGTSIDLPSVSLYKDSIPNCEKIKLVLHAASDCPKPPLNERCDDLINGEAKPYVEYGTCPPWNTISAKKAVSMLKSSPAKRAELGLQ